MEELLRTIVEPLLDEPEELEITYSEEGGKPTYELNTTGRELGRLIGRKGSRVKAVRSVTKSLSCITGERVNIRVCEKGSDEAEAEDYEDDEIFESADADEE